MERQKIIKLFVFVTVLCSCFSHSKAQLSKANWLLGTSFGYSQQKDKVSTMVGQGDQITQEGNIQVHGAYFIRPNHAIGLLVMQHFFSEKTKVKGTGFNGIDYHLKRTVTSFAAFGRSYKMVKKNKFAFFGQLSLAYNAGNSVFTTEYPDIVPKVTPIPIRAKINGFTASVRPGLVYFITGSLGLELTYGKLAFVYENIESSFEGRHLSTDKSSGVNTDFSLSSLALGISFYIPAQKN